MARSSKLESGFQDRLIKEIEHIFPNCMIFKMDQYQGIPDILVLLEDTWFSLENKRDENAEHQPNQDYYVNLMDRMSFSRFIYPENREDVLNEIREYFKEYTNDI